MVNIFALGSALQNKTKWICVKFKKEKIKTDKQTGREKGRQADKQRDKNRQTGRKMVG